MEPLRNRRLIHVDAPPVWKNTEQLQRISGQPRFIVWCDALRSIIADPGVIDRRGIVFGDVKQLHARRRYVVDGILDIIGLKGASLRGTTAGGKPTRQEGLRRFLIETTDAFYDQSPDSFGWIMVESCRDRIRSRHGGLTEKVTSGIVEVGHSPLVTRFRSRLMLPGRRSLSLHNVHLAIPSRRFHRVTRLVRTDILRQLPSPTGKLLKAEIACWSLARMGMDDEDLEKGFVASGLARMDDNINQARLVTWFSMNINNGTTTNYAIDINDQTDEILSFRYQISNARMVIDLDPWLDDWLLSGLIGQGRSNP